MLHALPSARSAIIEMLNWANLDVLQLQLYKADSEYKEQSGLETASQSNTEEKETSVLSLTHLMRILIS